jgi:hypothetical protein
MDVMKVWVVNRNVGRNGLDWEFCGVFSTKDKALEACLNDDYWIGPAYLDEFDDTEETINWVGAWYPYLEEDPELYHHVITGEG